MTFQIIIVLTLIGICVISTTAFFWLVDKVKELQNIVLDISKNTNGTISKMQQTIDNLMLALRDERSRH